MEIFNDQGSLGPTDISIDANQYDLLKNIVQSKVEDPAIVDEYIGAYALIARNLNITITEFVELLRSQGSDYDQDIFLAAYLNQSRVSNAKIGVKLNLNTPEHVRREIRA